MPKLGGMEEEDRQTKLPVTLDKLSIKGGVCRNGRSGWRWVVTNIFGVKNVMKEGKNAMKGLKECNERR